MIVLYMYLSYCTTSYHYPTHNIYSIIQEIIQSYYIILYCGVQSVAKTIFTKYKNNYGTNYECKYLHNYTQQSYFKVKY